MAAMVACARSSQRGRPASQQAALMDSRGYKVKVGEDMKVRGGMLGMCWNKCPGEWEGEIGLDMINTHLYTCKIVEE